MDVGTAQQNINFKYIYVSLIVSNNFIKVSNKNSLKIVRRKSNCPKLLQMNIMSFIHKGYVSITKTMNISHNLD